MKKNDRYKLSKDENWVKNLRYEITEDVSSSIQNKFYLIIALLSILIGAASIFGFNTYLKREVKLQLDNRIGKVFNKNVTNSIRRLEEENKKAIIKSTKIFEIEIKNSLAQLRKDGNDSLNKTFEKLKEQIAQELYLLERNRKDYSLAMLDELKSFKKTKTEISSKMDAKFNILMASYFETELNDRHIDIETLLESLVEKINVNKKKGGQGRRRFFNINQSDLKKRKFALILQEFNRHIEEKEIIPLLDNYKDNLKPLMLDSDIQVCEMVKGENTVIAIYKAMTESEINNVKAILSKNKNVSKYNYLQFYRDYQCEPGF